MPLSIPRVRYFVRLVENHGKREGVANEFAFDLWSDVEAFVSKNPPQPWRSVGVRAESVETWLVASAG